MSLVPGTRLGPYEVAARIGAGGMGEVYRAIDTKLKRLVAVKVLPAAVASEPDRLARLRREAELLASLNHANIAVVHGLEDAGGTLALVMELVEGPTLADRIAQGPIPVDEALAIATQIADALEAAHEQGIIHRDLKPANVKVSPDGRGKILDFGLAKALEPTGVSSSVSQSPTATTPAMTHAGVILGTAAYMSPEQSRGRPVDKRADIWAFGAVLYEMLTGRPAFKGDDVTETLAAIVKLDPDWAGLPEGVSRNLVWVLRKCLEKNPKHRLRDIADVRLILARAFDASPFETVTLSAGATRTARRMPVWVAAFVSALAIAVAGWALLRGRIDESASINRFTLAFRQTQAGGDTAFSADGQTLVYRALGTDGVPRLYRRSMDEFEATPIRDTEGGSYPFLSADGRWLGYVVGRTLRRIPLSGGPAETLTELPVFARGASWDVESIVVAGDEVGLLRVPAMGGRPTVLLSAAESRQLWYPQVLPGGEAILFTESRFNESAPRADVSELHILEVDSGQRRPLLSGFAGRFVPTGHIVFVREGALWAVPFDLKRLELRGTAVPVVEERGEAITQFAVADTGSLVYVPGGGPAARRRLVWVDRAGREEAIDAPPRGYTYPRLSPDGTRVAIDVRDQEIDIWIWDLVRETLTRLTFDPAQDEYPVWTHDGRQVFFASFRENAWGSSYKLQMDVALRSGSGPALPNSIRCLCRSMGACWSCARRTIWSRCH